MIDAHQHFWRIERGDYGWLTPALAEIYRDFGPADLAPILARHGIDATILVQAAPTIAETRWLLELAAATPFVAGVVGLGAVRQRPTRRTSSPRSLPIHGSSACDRWCRTKRTTTGCSGPRCDRRSKR